MILVTGGTGLVGSHLLYFLLKEGNTVRAIHRATSSFKEVKEVFAAYDALDSLYPKINWVVATINDIPALTDAFKNITQVYHCAALVDFTASYKTLKKINTEGTANVVNLSLHFNIKKLCYVSSIAALGENINNQPITENTTWNPDTDKNNYSIAKYGAEMEVWRGTQEGLNAVIVQPGVIFGEGHWNSGTGNLIKRIAKGISQYPTGSINLVDVKDVCAIMVLAMNSMHNNKAYLLVGHRIFYKDFFVMCAEIARVKPPKKELKKWKLMMLYYLEKMLPFRKPALSKSIINTLFLTKTYDNSRVKEEFNFTYTPLKETFERIIGHYLGR